LVIYVSPAVEKMTGYSPEETIGTYFQNYVTQNDLPRALQVFSNTIKGESTESLQLKTFKKDGSQIYIEVNASPIFRDEEVVGVQAIYRDITERKQVEKKLIQYQDHLEHLVEERVTELTKVNEQLQKEINERKQAEERLKESLKEKEILLKEIHHRVKNNLQIVCSLISLQSSYISEAQTLEALNDIRNRVITMALVHKLLYQSQDLELIDFHEYIRDLTNHLLQSAEAPGVVRLNINIDDDILLGIKTNWF
jgi:PAS domain S-box-containing protein